MNSEIVKQKFKPVFYDTKGILIVAKGNKIYSYNNKSLNYLFELPVKVYKRLLSYSKLYSRLTRYGVMAGVEYSGAYYFSFESYIYRYDLGSKNLTKDFTFDKGRGPLNYTVVEGIVGFEDGVYFGEYISNRTKAPVKVYKRTDCWRVAYEFSRGDLNHIHSLIVDKFRNKLWLLAGDFGDSAAIYEVKDNFNKVNAIASGKQIFRACVAFPTKHGLLYGTDTQQEFNSVRLLVQDGSSWRSEKLYDLNGSCIYGCELADYFVFSTATEPREVSNNKLHSLLDNKPGPGIKANHSEVIACKKMDLEFSRVFSIKKDIYPYRLFQFGAVTFPAGFTNTNTIHAYSIGGKGLDLVTVTLNLE